MIFGEASAKEQVEVSSIYWRGLLGIERKESMEASGKHKSGRRYDAGFKESAVGLVKSGRSFNEVAEDLGVSAWTIRMWVKRHDRGEELNQRKALADLTPEQRENRRLRQEIEYLRRQRDILKKALSIVSDGHPNDVSHS